MIGVPVWDMAISSTPSACIYRYMCVFACVLMCFTLFSQWKLILTHEAPKIPCLFGVHVHDRRGTADEEDEQVGDAEVEEEKVYRRSHRSTAKHDDRNSRVAEEADSKDDNVEQGPHTKQVARWLWHLSEASPVAKVAL